MTKLMTCEKKMRRSNPKVSPMSRAMPVRSAAKSMCIIGTVERARRMTPRPIELLHEEECVEHDRFREGDREDGLNQDRRRSARITADRRGGAHTDQTDANGGAQRGQTDVDAAGHLCK